MPDYIRDSVRQVIQMLVKGEYQEIVDLTNGSRASSNEIGMAITEYGRRLVVPPEDAYELIDAIEVEGSDPPRWSVDMPLWTEEEGESDLTLELTVTVLGADVRIELDGIHAL